ncbi:hypothetical protein BC937DRAFT_90684 [Endogone sp. FLAS-F59071]|nr:hypothetical protein BC937DRAFT_90684 [Endogone sp. FLAS-F59071]|eukprot:RUS16898.1 hypothetical protein BC937DRAFT_90684 [Endogone sp. FLAS-F59071]
METGAYYHHTTYTDYRYSPSPYSAYPYQDHRPPLPVGPLPQLQHTQPEQYMPQFAQHAFYEQTHYSQPQPRSASNILPILPPLVPRFAPPTSTAAVSAPVSYAPLSLPSTSYGGPPLSMPPSSSYPYSVSEPSAPLAIPGSQYPDSSPSPYDGSYSTAYSSASSPYTPPQPSLAVYRLPMHLSNPPSGDAPGPYPTTTATTTTTSRPSHLFYNLPPHHPPIPEESIAGATTLALLSDPDASRRNSLPIAALTAMSLSPSSSPPDHVPTVKHEHPSDPAFRRPSTASAPIPIQGHAATVPAPRSSPSSPPPPSLGGRPRRHSEQLRRSRVASFSESPSASALRDHHSYSYRSTSPLLITPQSTTPPSSLRSTDREPLFRCDDCGKAYKHPNCLAKHRWEHSPMWGMASKFLLSKHQQVQLMEAAAILVGMGCAADDGGVEDMMGGGLSATIPNGAA